MTRTSSGDIETYSSRTGHWKPRAALISIGRVAVSLQLVLQKG